MKLELIQKKYDRATEKYRKERKRHYNISKNDSHYKKYPSQLENIKKQAESGNPFSLRFRKKTGQFTNYKSSCEIDLVNEYGHSYRWYQLFGRINGKLVLNNYGYSNCTSKHVNHVSRVLGLLGIKHIEIQAPRGLQDLESAKSHIVYMLGEAVVENKYARKKHNYRIKYANSQITNLEKIGIKVSKVEILVATKQAEINRRNRLDRMKKQRKEAKEREAKRLAQLTLVETPELPENVVSMFGRR